MPGLRIAFLAYRGNPHSGGQGVYTRHLTRELLELGHRPTVFAGQPYPLVEDGVELVEVPSLDLYRQPDPFRIPKLREFKSLIDVYEFAIMCTAGFPEPRTFALRARKLLAARRDDFDIVHDNQCLAHGLLGMMKDGWPLVATLHHPITVDRELHLAEAKGIKQHITLRRWYGFIKMQCEVAAQIPRVLTVSESSRRDIVAQMGVPADRMHIVPVGVDQRQFVPIPEISRVPGRIMTTASADVPMKGLVPLLEAVAKVRTERHAELVVIGKPRAESRVGDTNKRLGLEDAVTFVSGVTDRRIVELYTEASVAVVPSLYEGFSLPAIEAMACGVPLVATTGGALPEVVGTDGDTGVLVPPGDVGELAAAIGKVLDEPRFADALGRAGRARVLDRFTWKATAEGTAAQYEEHLGRTRSERAR
jgi:glycosyltransferase involved in cell wall biosynthesis